MTPAAARVLANAASLARPVLGLVLVAAVDRGETTLLLAAVLVACATDWGDGVLARRAGIDSIRGRLIDNLCDFAFLVCAFAFLAGSQAWSAPHSGFVVRWWSGANWLPALALACSFGIYFLRITREIGSGKDPARSRIGHAAGVANYGLVITGAVETLPGVVLPRMALEAAMLVVALLNFSSVAENLRLLRPAGHRS